MKSERGYTPSRRFPSFFGSGSDATILGTWFTGTAVTCQPTAVTCRPDSYMHYTVASRGEMSFPRGSSLKFPCRAIRVLGLPVPFPTSA